MLQFFHISCISTYVIPIPVIPGMVQSSRNVGVQVAEGEFMMDIDNDRIHPDDSTTTPDEKDDGIGPKYTEVGRILRLLQLLLANECTRLEIIEQLASYYKVDNMATSRGSSSRRADRMFELDIKVLEELGFEIRRVKAKWKLVMRRRYCFISDSWSLPSVLGYLSFLSWASRHRIVDRYALCLYEDRGTCRALLAFATVPFWLGNIQRVSTPSIAQILSRFCVSSYVFYRREYRMPRHRNYSA